MEKNKTMVLVMSCGVLVYLFLAVFIRHVPHLLFLSTNRLFIIFQHVLQIHLKMEEKGTISKFFSRKEFKEESNPEESTHGKSLKLEPKSVKEENESEEKLETPCSAKTVDYDLKSELETFSHEGETKCKTKRYREELVDSKLKTDEIVKPRASPAKKKANLKSVDDKQPTLLSYFGKK